jgi:spore maturation protein CgeB
MSLKRGLRLLCVHPGASFSTHDVHVGLTEALKARGHEIFDYALDSRIENSGRWLNYCWKRGGKVCDRPGPPDVLYHAGEQLVARALRVMPDWVVVVSAMFLHPDVLVLLQRARIRVAVLFTESPYDDDMQERLLPWLQLAWTNERISAKRFGIGYLPHAYREGLHRPDAPVQDGVSVPSHDVVFVGTGFRERIDLLEAVDWTGIDFGLYGSWDMLGSRNPLRKHIAGGYQDNPSTAMLYRNAKIGVNLYRTSKGWGKDPEMITAAESLNPRGYELAATGCFHVSEHRAEVVEVFGAAVPTFKGADELGSAVRYWLQHEAERREVAARLPVLVAGNSWSERVIGVERDLLRSIAETPRAVVSV